MFAASLEASIALDKTGVITHVNPAAERLLRVAAPEVLGKPLVDVMLPPTHRSPDNANFASDLAAGRASGRRQELVAQRNDGRQFPLEVAIAEFKNGTEIGYIVSARDISTHRRLRAELARAARLRPMHRSSRHRATATRLKRSVAIRSVGPLARSARACAFDTKTRSCRGWR